MKLILLGLALAQLAAPGQPPPGGLVYPIGRDPAGAGAVYQLGPVGSPDFQLTPPSGAYASPVTPQRGSAVTVTRASAGAMYFNGTTLVSAAAGTLRVEPAGFLAEPSGINYALRSQELENALWSVYSALVAPNTTTAPDGTLTGDTLTSTDNYGSIYQTVTLSSTTLLAASGYIYPGTSPNPGIALNCVGGGDVVACACSTSNGSACSPVISGAQCVAGLTSPTAGAWTRLSVTANCTSATTTALILFATSYNGTSTIGQTATAWGAQMEATPNTSSYISTTTTATARAADVVTVSTTGQVLGTAGSATLLWTPEHSATGAGADRVLLSTTGLVVTYIAATAKVQAVIGGATALSSAQSWAAGTTHTIQYSYAVGSPVSLTVDGVTVTSGGNVGAFTPAANISLCGDGSTSAGANCTFKLCATNKPNC